MAGRIDRARREAICGCAESLHFDAAVGLNYVSFLQRRGSGARAEAVLTELSAPLANEFGYLDGVGAGQAESSGLGRRAGSFRDDSPRR